ncbi:DUF6371 domain-containing protein [Spirosoma knui]
MPLDNTLHRVKVAIVEAPKTAVIRTLYFSGFGWLAVGVPVSPQCRTIGSGPRSPDRTVFGSVERRKRV